LLRSDGRRLAGKRRAHQSGRRSGRAQFDQHHGRHLRATPPTPLRAAPSTGGAGCSACDRQVTVFQVPEGRRLRIAFPWVLGVPTAVPSSARSRPQARLGRAALPRVSGDSVRSCHRSRSDGTPAVRPVRASCPPAIGAF